MKEQLLAIYKGQCKSVELWVSFWQKSKDISSAKNALTALGKAAGQYGMMLAIWGDEDLPEDITALNFKNSQLWDEIMFSNP